MLVFLFYLFKEILKIKKKILIYKNCWLEEYIYVMCIMVFISLIVKLGVGNFFIVISCINYMYII